MEKYRRVDNRDKNQPQDKDQIRIRAGDVSTFPYLAYAHRHLTEERQRKVVVKATGNAIPKAVQVVELIKRRFKGLYQQNEISILEVEDIYEPIEQGLDTVSRKRVLTMFVSTLTFDPQDIDADHYGFQEPLPDQDIQQFQPSGRPYRGGAPRQFRYGPRGGYRREGYGYFRGGRGRGGYRDYQNGPNYREFRREYGGRGGGYRRGGRGYGRGRGYGGGRGYVGGRSYGGGGGYGQERGYGQDRVYGGGNRNQDNYADEYDNYDDYRSIRGRGQRYSQRQRNYQDQKQVPRRDGNQRRYYNDQRYYNNEQYEDKRHSDKKPYNEGGRGGGKGYGGSR